MPLLHPNAHSLPVHANLATTRVWLLRTAAWRCQWPRLQRVLDAHQQRRHDGIRDANRRRDRLLAQAIHRVTVAGALGWTPERLPLYRAASGQPRLALPNWHTSLSHADGLIAVALAPGPVGIDVEPSSTASLRPIADLVCTTAELARLHACGDFDAQLLATWVRKEAALKAVGLGLSCPMASFEAAAGARVALRDASGATITVQVDHVATADDCVVAVATVPGARVHWQWLQPQD